MRKGTFLGCRLPYCIAICIGIGWLMLMTSFSGNPSEVTGIIQHEGIVQKQGPLDTWSRQCTDSVLFNYTAPKRACSFSSEMDVPTKNCPRYNPMSGMLTSMTRSPQRHVPLSITSSDLTCNP